MCYFFDVFIYWLRSFFRGMIYVNLFNILYICCNFLIKVDVYVCINYVIILGFVYWNIFMIIRKFVIMIKNNNEYGIFVFKVFGIIFLN